MCSFNPFFITMPTGKKKKKLFHSPDKHYKRYSTRHISRFWKLKKWLICNFLSHRLCKLHFQAAHPIVSLAMALNKKYNKLHMLKENKLLHWMGTLNQSCSNTSSKFIQCKMSPLIEVVCYTWQDVMVLDSKNFFVVAKLAIFISIEKRHKPACTKSTYQSAVFFLRIQATMCEVSPSSQVSAGCSCVSGFNFHNSNNILCRVPRKLRLCQYSRNTDVDITVIYFTVVLTSYPLNV